MEEELYCAGCGILIQTEDKDKIGYAPPAALKRDVVICQRCFRLANYNEIHPVNMTDEDYRSLVSTIAKTRSLVVLIVDLFDFNGSWIKDIKQLVGKNDILLVGNKMDLLPKSTNFNKVSNWLRQSLKRKGLKPLDVLVMSAEKKIGIENVAEAIDYYRNGKDVHVVGCTNVGKSTFINQLIKIFGGQADEAITTSHFPGTTLNFIGIPLNETQMLYDTPGIVNREQAAHYVSPEDYKQMMPKKEIKPKVFQLNEQQTLFLGGLGRMDYESGGRRSFVCYVSNRVTIHRTKLEQADHLYQTQLGGVLNPPQETPDTPPEMVRHEFVLEEPDTDIVFSGLGWITVKGKGAVVAVYAQKGMGVTLRSSIING